MDPATSSPDEELVVSGVFIVDRGLVGFFNLGATLMLALELGGLPLLIRLLEKSWLHGPSEFFFVLLCVAEPARMMGIPSGGDGIVGSLRGGRELLLISLIGLLVSASIEVLRACNDSARQTDSARVETVEETSLPAGSCV